MLNNRAKLKKNKLILVLLVICLVLSFTGCEKDASIIFGNNEPQITYTYDHTIYLPMEKVRTLNPIVSKDEDTYQISKLVYDGLFEMDEQLIPQNVLASSYTYSDDGLMLSIKLNSKAKFSDGYDLTGDDVKYTIEAIQTAAKAGEGLYASNVASIKSVELVKGDSKSVNIKFSSTYGTGIENFTFPILPAHQYKNAVALRAVKKDFVMIGTGMYAMGDYFDLSSLELKANPNYWGTKPTNELMFQILPDHSYAVNMAQSGDISLFMDDATNRDMILSRYDLNVTPYTANEAIVLGFNCASSKLPSAKSRQAIAYSIDTDNILENAFYKNGVLCDSLFYPGFYGTENAGDEFKKSTEKAKAFLFQDNIKDVNEDGLLENPEGKELVLNILTNSEDAMRVNAAYMIQSDLGKIGLNAQVIAVDSYTFQYKLAIGDYDVYIGDITFDERYDLRNLVHSAYGNSVRYSNPKADDIVLTLEQGTSIGNRFELITGLKKCLKDDMPYYCLLYKTKTCYYSEYFDGEPKAMFNNYYKGCENWVCKYPENSEEN